MIWATEKPDGGSKHARTGPFGAPDGTHARWATTKPTPWTKKAKNRKAAKAAKAARKANR